MNNVFSNILCIANMNITEALDHCLAELALPEVFVQRAKQMSLIDKQSLFGLRPVIKLEENRSLIYRFYVPREHGEGVMRRIIEATDLRMGGRGSIFARHVNIHRGTPLSFDNEKLENLCGKKNKILPEESVLINCTVPRGSGEAIARAILELGICVPVIFFGTGMGFRDKLGFLKIAIPIEKEIIWFIVPRSDADLVEKTIIPIARLDTPGKGFLYRCFVHAPAVNVRIRHGKRDHVATMEQVIAALDDVHGSSDWRRLGSRKSKTPGNETEISHTRGLFFIGKEEEVEVFRKTVMDNGARGATLNTVEMRSYNSLGTEHPRESNVRSLCDTIVSPAVEESAKKPLAKTSLFNDGRTCLVKSLKVEVSSAIRLFGSSGKNNGRNK